VKPKTLAFVSLVDCCESNASLAAVLNPFQSDREFLQKRSTKDKQALPSLVC
jgi:hypothetical protein